MRYKGMSIATQDLALVLISRMEILLRNQGCMTAEIDKA